jgi:NAD(P)H dehydrogenase (quinone)
MKILLVYAHHEPSSFNSALKDLAVSTLTSQRHTVKVSDLYAMKFNPVASKQDFAKLPDSNETNYMLMQKSVATKNGEFAKDIKEEQEKVRWADFLLFQFPVWWFGAPSILKGWFDRVLACGFAWDFGKIYANGLLRGKKAMISVTTGGGPNVYSKKGLHEADINEILHPIQHGTLYFCGMDVLPPHVAYAVIPAGDQGRKKMLEDFKQRLLTLEKTPPFKFHPVEKQQ